MCNSRVIDQKIAILKISAKIYELMAKKAKLEIRAASLHGRICEEVTLGLDDLETARLVRNEAACHLDIANIDYELMGLYKQVELLNASDSSQSNPMESFLGAIFDL